MNLFKTSNYEIICECRNYLCFCLPSELLAKCYNVYSWLNSIVSNRRMIVIVNDRYYAAYERLSTIIGE